MNRPRVLHLTGLSSWILLCSATLAQPPAGYYASANPASATVLRSSLHEIIDDHTRFPYTANATDTWDILREGDEDPADPDRVLDVYRNASFPKAPGGNANYNREHSWPKSYGFPDDGASNYPYTDCHHLFLASSSYNSSRHNKPYRTCDPSCNERTTDTNAGAGGGSGTYIGNSNWTETRIWEAWTGRRGDVARALLYMDVRYEGGFHGVTGHDEPDLILTDDLNLIQTSGGDNVDTAYMGDLSTILEWHAADPVDPRERRHHEAVFRHQGNRNPFVDHPEWAACIFQNQCDGGAPPPPQPPPTGTTLAELIVRLEELEQELAEVRVLLEALQANP